MNQLRGYRWALLAGVGLLTAGLFTFHGNGRALAADEPQDGAKFFETRVWPVLSQNCAGCHANGKHKGDFTIDSRDAILKGGEDGVMVISGKPAESKLIAILRYENKGSSGKCVGDR